MKTLIVDNYDSFTFNLVHLAAVVRGVEPIVVSNDEITWDEFKKLDIDSVIISAGPGRPENERDFGICSRIILESDLPILGICLGLQGIGYLFGGAVVRAPEPVHGRTSAVFHENQRLFANVPQGFEAVRYHSLVLRRPLPESLRVTAWTNDGIVMGLEHQERPIWAVQFHPESVSTEYGAQLFRNFADMAGLPKLAVTDPTVGAVYDRAFFVNVEEKRAVTDRAYSRLRVFSRKLNVYPDPEQTFVSLFGKQRPSFWLDTPESAQDRHRFSFMGSADGERSFWLTHSAHSNRTVVHASGRRQVLDVPLLDFLQTELARRRVEAADLPFDFNGGFVGYFGYELKAECGSPSKHKPSHPDACLIFPERLIAFDHHDRVVHLVSIGTPEDAGSAESWFDDIEDRMRGVAGESPMPAPRQESIRFRLEQSRQEYLDNIDRSLRLIAEGESYEICLTNRLTARTTVDPLVYYRVLRRFNPAPYSAFLQFPDVSVACSSPELFLRIDCEGAVHSKPIKGTAPRSDRRDEDERLREALRTGVKTRSENLMIVDLLRHDLGRVCEIGSVHTPEMMEVDSYRNLHQLFSTVAGRLRPEATAVDCLRSAFPGGSMTGAPKLRTMELIDRLESSARGVYSGAIGYIALNGAANLNIVIRTAVFAREHVSIGAGGAIVALSDPAAEFDEMILKSRALVDAFRPLVQGAVSIEDVDTISD